MAVEGREGSAGEHGRALCPEASRCCSTATPVRRSERRSGGEEQGRLQGPVPLQPDDALEGSPGRPAFPIIFDENRLRLPCIRV